METYNRKATTLNEQVKILKARNLIIEDEKFAEKVLSQIGYFRFKGYCLPYYKTKDIFEDGVTIESIYNVHRFDERFRMLMFQMIGHLEVSLKARIGYMFALNYGPLGYYSEGNFSKEHHFNRWIKEFEVAIDQSSKRRELYAAHYIKNYNNTFPVWVALEMTNFGNLSKFFSNLRQPFQNKVAKNLTGLTSVYLSNWFYTLTNIRNICAHNGRLYDRVLPIKARLNPKINKKISNEKAFVGVYIASNLCSDDEYWENFERNLSNLISIYESHISLNKLGFPEEWKEIIQENRNKKR